MTEKVTPTVEMKLNIVSLVNTGILLGLLGTAATSLYTFISRVDHMQATILQITNDVKEANSERKSEVNALRAQDTLIQSQIFNMQTTVTGRLSTVEAEIKAIGAGLNRVEKVLDKKVP